MDNATANAVNHCTAFSFSSPKATDKGLTHSKTFKSTPTATVISKILFEKKCLNAD